MEKFYRQYLTSKTFTHGGWSRTFTVEWSGSKQKRIFDFISAAMALILLSPLMLLAAIAVKLSSPGPVLFKQTRTGNEGREFVIYKFRTMRVQKPGEGPSVTRKGDSRLTSVGSFLRRCKIDEFPQLFNVLKGDMSLVGARPKLPHHQIYPLNYRPGITGAASLAFRNEEILLHEVTHHCLDDYQIRVLMPLKKHIDQTYMQHATFLSDLRILFATALGTGERLDYARLQSFQDSLLSLDTALRGFPLGMDVETESASFVADAAG